MPTNNLIFWRSTTHQEMTSMAQQLQILNSELLAAQQEDEGATYRIEELERYRTMSNEAASHLEFRYSQLTIWIQWTNRTWRMQSWYMWAQMQMLISINSDWNWKTQRWTRSMRPWRSAMPMIKHVRSASRCLRLPIRTKRWSTLCLLNVRRLETELDAADAKRDEIMREFRSNIRSEHDRYAECEHHLACGGIATSDCNYFAMRAYIHNWWYLRGRLSEEFSSETSGMRDMRIMGLRSELHMKQKPI